MLMLWLLDPLFAIALLELNRLIQKLSKVAAVAVIYVASLKANSHSYMLINQISYACGVLRIIFINIVDMIRVAVV